MIALLATPGGGVICGILLLMLAIVVILPCPDKRGSGE